MTLFPRNHRVAHIVSHKAVSAGMPPASLPTSRWLLEEGQHCVDALWAAHGEVPAGPLIGTSGKATNLQF